MIATGGAWDAHEPNVYFIAAGISDQLVGMQSHTHMLCAMNDINTEEDIRALRAFVGQGKRVFIDSGVYSLSMRHAEANGMTFFEALGVAPSAVLGFSDLYDKYVALIQSIGSKVWGYIELDQGGRDNKIATRAKLEALGLRPIPVYHPMTDGWDYFDYLAQRYDRIAFGNVVQAERSTRLRLVATAWERKQKYPNLWIHMLGLTPNETLNAFPLNSCDSSTWLGDVRWPDRYHSQCALQFFSRMGNRFAYRRAPDQSESPTGHRKARRLGGYEAHLLMLNWRSLQADYAQAST